MHVLSLILYILFSLVGSFGALQSKQPSHLSEDALGLFMTELMRCSLTTHTLDFKGMKKVIKGFSSVRWYFCSSE